MKLNCGFVAILTLGVAFLGCGGEIIGGSNHETSKDAGLPTPVDDAGGPAVEADAGVPVVDSGGPDTAKDTGPVDAGPDHGSPSTTYPAFMPFMPPVVNHGGPVLASPQIVTISWTTDPLHATWEWFDDTIGGTDYWKTTTSEYGVGAAVGGPTNHVELSTAEPTWTDTDVASFVQTNALDTTTSGWPAPSANVLYTIYLPTSTSRTFQIQNPGLVNACMSGAYGYHDSVSVPGVGNVAYAVVIQCPGGYGSPPTESASHELIEAVTDPDPFSSGAYDGVNDNTYFAWDFFQAGFGPVGQPQSAGTEVGDMCEVYYDKDYSDSALGTVQRTWSNASATAGHAPCVPAESGPYFNVTPLNQEAITVASSAINGHTGTSTMGYSIPVGKTKTFPVGFYSDGPTSGPWTISAFDLGDAYDGQYFTSKTQSKVTVSTDITQGENGQVAYVTVTVDSMDQTKCDLIMIRSVLGSAAHHYMPILICSN